MGILYRYFLAKGKARKGNQGHQAVVIVLYLV